MGRLLGLRREREGPPAGQPCQPSRHLITLLVVGAHSPHPSLLSSASAAARSALSLSPLCSWRRCRQAKKKNFVFFKSYHLVGGQSWPPFPSTLSLTPLMHSWWHTQPLSTHIHTQSLPTHTHSLSHSLSLSHTRSHSFFHPMAKHKHIHTHFFLAHQPPHSPSKIYGTRWIYIMYLNIYISHKIYINAMQCSWPHQSIRKWTTKVRWPGPQNQQCAPIYAHKYIQI